MDEQEYDDPPADVRPHVKRFEESITSRQPVFFDVETFEDIIGHYEAREEWQRAMEALDYALNQHPYCGDFHVRKAGLLIYFRKYKQAMDTLDHAESLEPGDVSIPLLRSDIYLERKQHRRSEKIIKTALEHCDDAEDRIDLLLELSDIYEDWNRFDQVFNTLKEVLDSNPENEEALSRMWYCVELAGKQEESILLHTKILDEHPYSYLAWHNLGNAYYDLNLYERAIEAYDFATTINEQWDLAYRDCGDAFFQLKQYREAIIQFEKAIEASKPYEELFFAIGYCYEKLKDVTTARQYYRKATAAEPEYSEAYYRIGETFRRERQWEQAIHYYKKALRHDSENAVYLVALAQSFYNTGDLDPFIFTCQSVMTLPANKKNRAHYEKLIGFLIDLGCIEDALNLMDFASDEKGMSPVYPYMRAACYFKMGNKQQAMVFLQEGLAIKYSRYKVLYKFAPELKSNALVASVIEQYK